MVLLMCSKISAVLRGRSPKNFLIFSLILVVFMRFSSCHEAFSHRRVGPLLQMNEAAHITIPPNKGCWLPLMTILEAFIPAAWEECK